MILSVDLRRRIRRIRSEVALIRHRLRWKEGKPAALKLISAPAGAPPLPQPAIGVIPPPGVSAEELSNNLHGQTETSWTLDAERAPWLYFPEGDGRELPPEMLEMLLLVGASCGVDSVLAGGGLLLRAPGPSPGPGLGMQLSVDGGEDEAPFLRAGDILHTRPDRPVIPLPLHSPEVLLRDLPEVPGPRTAVFVLPFLAIGGAEQLLFDLLEGWTQRFRVLIVCLDEHRPELGSSIGKFTALGLPVYRFGDRLPRRLRIPALRHLIRRWKAEALVSWNGCIDFYDDIEEIYREHPGLRIYDQHYNHEGAWLEWLRPEITRVFTAQIAVNAEIARALRDRGASRVEIIHHAVRIPELPSDTGRQGLRRQRRRELNIPEAAILVGSFIRLHPQKRPMDIIRLARRMENSGFHFLLVGGGPEEGRVEAELRKRPLKNFLRLPMQEDTGPLFEALDLALMSSQFEGLPVFLLEAMAREIPCVATDVGEIASLFSEGGGILIAEAGDLPAFEAALEEFRNPRRRLDAGKRARARVESAHGLNEYRRAYERLIFP